MNNKLHTKLFTMAAATLGLSLAAGCAKKAEEPAAAESGEAASGAESSCGSGSCGAHHHKHEEKESAADQEVIEPGDAPAGATEK